MHRTIKKFSFTHTTIFKSQNTAFTPVPIILPSTDVVSAIRKSNFSMSKSQCVFVIVLKYWAILIIPNSEAWLRYLWLREQPVKQFDRFINPPWILLFYECFLIWIRNPQTICFIRPDQEEVFILAAEWIPLLFIIASLILFYMLLGLWLFCPAVFCTRHFVFLIIIIAGLHRWLYNLCNLNYLVLRFLLLNAILLFFLFHKPFAYRKESLDILRFFSNKSGNTFAENFKSIFRLHSLKAFIKCWNRPRLNHKSFCLLIVFTTDYFQEVLTLRNMILKKYFIWFFNHNNF